MTTENKMIPALLGIRLRDKFTKKEKMKGSMAEDAEVAFDRYVPGIGNTTVYAHRVDNSYEQWGSTKTALMDNGPDVQKWSDELKNSSKKK